MGIFALLLIPVVFALAIALVVIRVRQDRRRLWWLAAGALSSVAFAVFWLPDFTDLSRDLVILQAGLSELNIDHIFGRGNHFCFMCMQAGSVLDGMSGGPLPVESITLFLRVMHVINVGALVALCLEVTGSLIWPFFFVAGFVGIPVVAVGARTNYPSAFLLTLFFVGLLSGAVFLDRRSGFVARFTGLVGLIAATAVALLTRPDIGALGLGAIGVVIASDDVVRPRLARMAGFLRNFLRLPRPGESAESGLTAFGRPNLFVAALVAVLTMIGLEVLSNVLDERIFPVWIIDGLNPMNPSTANMFFHMFLLLPFSMAVIAIAGIVRQLRTPWAFLGLPIVMIFLLKTYSSASRYDQHTLFRMFSVLLPMLLVFSAWGLKDVNAFIGRHVPDVRLRLLVAALLIASFSINTPFVRRELRVHRPPEGYLTAYEEPEGLLGMNPQLEVRFLKSVLDSWPECVVRTKVIGTDSYESIAAGRSQGDFVDVWFSRSGVSRTPPKRQPACELFYRSLDCNLLGRHACDEGIADAEVLREISFASRPYGDYLRARYSEPIVLGVYRVRP